MDVVAGSGTGGTGRGTWRSTEPPSVGEVRGVLLRVWATGRRGRKVHSGQGVPGGTRRSGRQNRNLLLS